MRCKTFEEQELERPVVPLSPELADYVRRQPEAVCEALLPLLMEDRLERIEEVLSSRLRSVVVVLDHLLDPHNRAAVLRTAEALGVQEIHAIQPDGRWPLSRRVTQGCHKWLDVTVHRSTESCVAGLKGRGYLLIEASEKTLSGGAEPTALAAAGRKVALCMGNEHAGVTEALRAHCEGQLGLPMWGFTRSFNVSVAAALLLGQLIEGRPRGLEGGDLIGLRARYYALSVRSPLEVLRLKLGRAR